MESVIVRNLMLLELFPTALAVELCGVEFTNRRICFHCDNFGVVQAINSLSASSLLVVRLLRHLVLLCLRLNICVSAVHIPGVENEVVDALSCLQWERLRRLAPGAERLGVPCLWHLWELVLTP